MRILFVSGVDVGGAPRSTLELARVLAARGHDIGVVLGMGGSTGRSYTTLTKVVIKVREATGVVWPRALLRPFGPAGSRCADDGGVATWRTARPENALRGVLKEFKPEVVVASSFPREQMRWMLRDAQKVGIPFGVYMREEHSVTHLTVSRLDLDLVLANSSHLTARAEAAGYLCSIIPSIVDLSAAEAVSNRREVLLVNPVEENRPGIMRDLAMRRPDIPCVLQESWQLSSTWRAELESWTRDIPNLDLRPSTERPADLYRDARILVAPYPTGRPRVVLEAQHNAIPVVALGQPALIEAVGPGGALVAADSSVDAWVKAVESLWDDQRRYGELCDLAHEHARRHEIATDRIAEQFEQTLAVVTT